MRRKTGIILLLIFLISILPFSFDVQATDQPVPRNFRIMEVDDKKSIGYDLLSKMPANGVLVNTARKEVIDEDGLVKAMEERSDLGYISDIAPDNKDVFEGKFDGRYFFTPKKMGAQTEEANINAGVAAAEQIVNYFKEGDETFRVNK